MDERVMQFRVGVMVLATVLITAILVALVRRSAFPGPRQYTIYVRFPRRRA